MDHDSPISEWATERFGDAAPVIRRAVANALVEAYQTSLESQDVARLPNKYPLGGNWPAPFVRLVEALQDMPGARVIRPKGAKVDLVSVQGNLFFPFRHGTDLTKPLQRARLTTQFAKDVFSGFRDLVRGTPTLFDDMEPTADLPNWVHALMEDAKREPKLILLPFVSNPEAKQLLAAWWGEAELLEDGYLSWLDGCLEPLPLAAPPSGRGDGKGRPVGPINPLPRQLGSAGALPSFDEGELPELDFPTHPRPVSSPDSEAGPQAPTAMNENG